MTIPETLSWIEISRSALEHNVRTFRRLIGKDVELYAVVKANAYGHGMQLVAPVLLAAGVDGLAVHTVGEGIRLRQQGIQVPVLVLGYVPVEQAAPAVEHGLDVTVFTRATLEALAHAVSWAGSPAYISRSRPVPSARG